MHKEQVLMDDGPRYPVFIVGSPRSGSSILVQALMSAGYVGFREGHVLPVLADIERAVDRLFAMHGSGGNRKVLLNNVDQPALKADLASVVKAHVEAVTPAGPWLDKTITVGMIRSISILRTLWPDSVFVFVKRRGLENVASRLAKFPGHGFERHCRDWADIMAAWRAVRCSIPQDRTLEIDQYDMLIEAGTTAARLRAFLALPGEAEDTIRQDFTLRRPQQRVDGSAGRILSLDETGWSARDVEVFLDVCKPELEAFGYSLDETYYATKQNAGEPASGRNEQSG